MTRHCLAYGPLTANGDISTIVSVHKMLPGLLIATGRDADTTKVKGLVLSLTRRALQAKSLPCGN